MVTVAEAATAQRVATEEMEGAALSVRGVMEAMEGTANTAEEAMGAMGVMALPEAEKVDQGERDLREKGTMEEMDIRDNKEKKI